MIQRIGTACMALTLCLGSAKLMAQQPDNSGQRSQGLQSVEPGRVESDQRSSAGRMNQHSGDDRQRRSPRDANADEPWFDPGWWHEWPDDGRRRPPRDGGGDEPGFDPGWWHEWPDDGRRRDDRIRPPRDRYGHTPRPRSRSQYDDRRGGYRIPAGRPRAVLGAYFRDTPSGPRIDSLVQDGPAAESGLRRGDLLLAIDGRRVADTEAVSQLLRRYRPGQEVHLHFERGDRIRQTTTVLESRREVY